MLTNQRRVLTVLTNQRPVSVPGGAHEEGAHVGLEELPAGGHPALQLHHGHGVGLGGVGRQLLLHRQIWSTEYSTVQYSTVQYRYSTVLS